MTYGVLHFLLDRVTLVFIPPSLLSVGPEKRNSHTLFGRVAFLPPRGHSTPFTMLFGAAPRVATSQDIVAK